jgi:hypothetical protein
MNSIQSNKISQIKRKNSKSLYKILKSKKEKLKFLTSKIRILMRELKMQRNSKKKYKMKIRAYKINSIDKTSNFRAQVQNRIAFFKKEITSSLKKRICSMKPTRKLSN